MGTLHTPTNSETAEHLEDARERVMGAVSRAAGKVRDAAGHVPSNSRRMIEDRPLMMVAVSLGLGLGLGIVLGRALFR